jgi:hypothetical protein
MGHWWMLQDPALGARVLDDFWRSVLVAIGTLRAYSSGARFRASAWARMASNAPLSAIGAGAGLSLILTSGPGLYLLFAVQLLVVPAATYNTWDVVFAPEYRRRKADRATKAASPRES